MQKRIRVRVATYALAKLLYTLADDPCIIGDITVTLEDSEFTVCFTRDSILPPNKPSENATK